MLVSGLVIILLLSVLLGLRIDWRKIQTAKINRLNSIQDLLHFFDTLVANSTGSDADNLAYRSRSILELSTSMAEQLAAFHLLVGASRIIISENLTEKEKLTEELTAKKETVTESIIQLKQTVTKAHFARIFQNIKVERISPQSIDDAKVILLKRYKDKFYSTS